MAKSDDDAEWQDILDRLAAEGPPSPASRALTSADILAVQKRLLAGTARVGLEPPRDWPAWRLPADPLDLDRTVLGGIGAKTGFRPLDRETLAAAGIPCPVWAARQYLFAGILAGTADRGREDSGRFNAGTLTDAAADAAALRRAVDAFANLHLRGGGGRALQRAWTAALPIGDDAAARSVAGRLGKAASRVDDALRSLAEIEDLLNLAVKNNSPDPLAVEIACSMAACYALLTGKKPSIKIGGPFDKFAKDAFLSLQLETLLLTKRAASYGIQRWIERLDLSRPEGDHT